MKDKYVFASLDLILQKFKTNKKNEYNSPIFWYNTNLGLNFWGDDYFGVTLLSTTNPDIDNITSARNIMRAYAQNFMLDTGFELFNMGTIRRTKSTDEIVDYLDWTLRWTLPQQDNRPLKIIREELQHATTKFAEENSFYDRNDYRK